MPREKTDAAEPAEKKKRPNMEARAKQIAEKANFVSHDEYGFAWTDILDILVQLLPLLSLCGFMAKNVRRPGPLVVNRINAACRRKFANKPEMAEVLAGTILADGETLTQGELDAMRGEL